MFLIVFDWVGDVVGLRLVQLSGVSLCMPDFAHMVLLLGQVYLWFFGSLLARTLQEEPNLSDS